MVRRGRGSKDEAKEAVLSTGGAGGGGGGVRGGEE